MEVIRDISPRDDMLRPPPKGGGREEYFEIGFEALTLVRRAMRTAGIDQCRTILDLPSGHGRVMRTLRAAFPEAKLTACDINRDAVDFCVETFDAEPNYADVQPREIDFAHDFDLIWSGSLLTHLDAERFVEFLELFESHLAPRGLLVCTTNGGAPYKLMRRLAPNWDPSEAPMAPHLAAHWIEQAEHYFPIPKDIVPNMLDSYEKEGFAYADYQFMDDFGATLSSPAWVCKQLERFSGLRLVTYFEEGWGSIQDVFACQRTETPVR